MVYRGYKCPGYNVKGVGGGLMTKIGLMMFGLFIRAIRSGWVVPIVKIRF